MPTSSYAENGQKKTRGENIGVMLRTTYDDGSTRLSLRLKATVLAPQIFALLTRNEILTKGDDSVFCSVWEREKRARSGGDAAAGGAAEGHADEEQVPF